MGIIELENMEFFARHGCFYEEQLIGSLFTVSLCMEVDVEQAVKSDRLEDTLNYQQAYLLVQREMEQPSCLLEHVAGRILSALYGEFPYLKNARVKISKRNPPLGGQVANSSVTLSR